MKMYFSQKLDTLQTAEEDFTPVTLQDSIEKPAGHWILPTRVLITLLMLT